MDGESLYHIHDLVPVRIEQKFASLWGRDKTLVYKVCSTPTCTRTDVEKVIGVWWPEDFGLEPHNIILPSILD